MAYVSLVEVFQEGKASFKEAFDIMAKEHVENEGMIFTRNRLRRPRPRRPARNSKMVQNFGCFSRVKVIPKKMKSGHIKSGVV